jgi:hypothetical protein
LEETVSNNESQALNNIWPTRAVSATGNKLPEWLQQSL